MDGFVHFMRCTGLSATEINRALDKGPQLLKAFQSAVQVTLKARRVPEDQILSLIGPVPKR